MKKLLMSLIGLSILSIGIYSCTKNNENYDLDTKEISKKYLSNLKLSNRHSKIIAADIMGGWVGFKAGGELGAVFGQPHWGAAIGALGVGALNSYGAALCCGGVHLNNFGNLAFYVPSSDNLPYAQIGLRHNEIVKNSMQNNWTGEGVTLNNIIPNNTFNTEELLIINQMKPLIYEHFQKFKNGEFNDLNSCNLYIDQNISDVSVSVIMKNYLNTIFNVSNEQNIENLTLDYENYINNSNLNQVQKSQLLSGLSIARHSNKFWHIIL